MAAVRRNKQKQPVSLDAVLAAMASADLCPRCGDPVYHAEQRIAEGRLYHPTCYTCRACDASLNASNIAPSPDEIFCKTCYGRVRGPRGYGFGMGKGVFSMTMTSLQVDGITEVLHNPAMMGALDKEQGMVMVTEGTGEPKHPLDCECRQCVKGQKFVKAPAHDNLRTSNAGNTALAYAWPLIKKPSVPALDTVPRREDDAWPPNTVSAVPTRPVSRSRPHHTLQDEPVAFLEQRRPSPSPTRRQTLLAAATNKTRADGIPFTAAAGTAAGFQSSRWP